MFGTKYLNDEHDCNVVSMNSLNIQNVNDCCIQNANDCCTSHEKNVSYKHVNFVVWKDFVKTCLIGMIDFARSINMMEPIDGSK